MSIEIKLKDGSPLQLEKNSSAFDAATAISENLARNVCLAKVNGVDVDLRTKLNDGDTLELLKFEQKAGKKAFWHTTSHIMAQAIKRLYPDAMLAIGPAIDNGFYYDIDLEQNFTNDDLEKIEKEMQNIVKENLPLEFYTLSRDDALQWAKDINEDYKVELIEDLPPDETISFYKQGDFVDLCAGPHLMNTGMVKAFKLLQVSGAYWRGDEKNKMLQRIYGISFPDKKQLKEYLVQMEEARKRDHNKLGRELGYFTTIDFIGQGLPLFMPKGAKTLQILERFVEDEEQKRGYQITKTPLIAKSDLFKISGHWDHYRDGMFIMGDPEEKDGETAYALRPMTCPFQYQIYKAETRSYRDLPIRLNETSTLFRNESSGEMHGLIRLRQFTISEAHLMVTPEQLKEEFLGAFDLANFMLKALGLDQDVSYRFSIWDPDNKDKYIGDPQEWQNAQDSMQAILDSTGIEYETGIGEAAFYGPKLDIQIRNVFGKEDTLITIQIDFQLAERFDMVYIDSNGEKKHPHIIHRTSIGCYERTLALLIEKYAGALPLWVAPEQIVILPIAEKHFQGAKDAASRLTAAGFRVKVDSRNEKVGRKIRDAQLEKIPYMLVMGDQEIENQNYSVRQRKAGDLGIMSESELIERLQHEVDTFAKD
ncbi:MAG: threonine--tRNA ligase [Clostridiaceae bacterium]|nr:threonine--tRNA ligase [Clostridiaceae bacterium]